MCAFAFAAAVAVIAGSLYRLSLALFELATPEHCLRRGDTCLCQTSAKFYHGRGCEECRFTVFKGRTGIYEILIMEDKLRPLVIERTSSNTIKAAACANGMKTLRDDGWVKVKAGITTVEEVGRVTQEDEDLTVT